MVKQNQFQKILLVAQYMTTIFIYSKSIDSNFMRIIAM